MKAVRRFQIADYLECGKGDEKEYSLCGVGYRTLNEQPGAQVEDTIYVCDKCSSSDIESYQTAFAFEADMFKDAKAVNEVWTIGHDQLTGEDAQRNFVRVDLYDPVASKQNTYRARKFLVAIEVSSMDGDAGKKMKVGGNFKAVGDFVSGEFDTSTKTFTADAE